MQRPFCLSPWSIPGFWQTLYLPSLTMPSVLPGQHQTEAVAHAAAAAASGGRDLAEGNRDQSDPDSAAWNAKVSRGKNTWEASAANQGRGEGGGGSGGPGRSPSALGDLAEAAAADLKSMRAGGRASLPLSETRRSGEETGHEEGALGDKGQRTPRTPGRKKRLCECGRVQPRFAMPGHKAADAKWCAYCPTKPEGAVDVVCKRREAAPPPPLLSGCLPAGQGLLLCLFVLCLHSCYRLALFVAVAPLLPLLTT